ncbi:hypothetical protein H4219_002572 [Mycoemilia scoparia]|uniref:Uncharacterized protein n=1 Tax=Mycoemilia scoparia TaxID=417184 RepID=A0A9W8A263_9FUNG|nr:hypothetical protein H4219_002572 [Mycoemilia scoparia]
MKFFTALIAFALLMALVVLADDALKQYVQAHYAQIKDKANGSKGLMQLLKPKVYDAMQKLPNHEFSSQFDPATYDQFVQNIGGPQEMRSLLKLGGFNDIPQ